MIALLLLLKGVLCEAFLPVSENAVTIGTLSGNVRTIYFSSESSSETECTAQSPCKSLTSAYSTYTSERESAETVIFNLNAGKYDGSNFKTEIGISCTVAGAGAGSSASDSVIDLESVGYNNGLFTISRVETSTQVTFQKMRFATKNGKAGAIVTIGTQNSETNVKVVLDTIYCAFTTIQYETGSSVTPIIDTKNGYLTLKTFTINGLQCGTDVAVAVNQHKDAFVCESATFTSVTGGMMGSVANFVLEQGDALVLQNMMCQSCNSMKGGAFYITLSHDDCSLTIKNCKFVKCSAGQMMSATARSNVIATGTYFGGAIYFQAEAENKPTLSFSGNEFTPPNNPILINGVFAYIRYNDNSENWAKNADLWRPLVNSATGSQLQMSGTTIISGTEMEDNTNVINIESSSSTGKGSGNNEDDSGIGVGAIIGIVVAVLVAAVAAGIVIKCCVFTDKSSKSENSGNTTNMSNHTTNQSIVINGNIGVTGEGNSVLNIPQSSSGANTA